MEYNVDYFIAKFEAIPEEKWHIGDYNNEQEDKFCALGHCGCRNRSKFRRESIAWDDLAESKTLDVLFSNSALVVANVNDGNEKRYKQPTPKQRILAALYDIKKLQEPKLQVKEIIRYVAVDKELRKEAKELVVNEINN